MMNQTTVTAIRALVHLAIVEPEGPVTPSDLAEVVAESPSYLAKVNTMLARAGIVRTRRGAHGGVELAKSPAAISLRDVYIACQGRPVDVACSDGGRIRLVCGFHRAMIDLEQAIHDALARWSIQDLADRPQPAPSLRDVVSCRLVGLGSDGQI